MMTLALSVFRESWELLWNAAPYMVLGLLLGGLIKTSLNGETIRRHLGGKGFLPVLKASLLGIPLPLCSCSVLPVGAALHREGASRGATAAFLIATPESGVDSMAISYALLDPLLTVLRPLVAFVTAFCAGAALVLTGKNSRNSSKTPLPPEPPKRSSSCCCCGGGDTKNLSPKTPKLSEKLLQGWHYATGDLWGHLALPFATGLLLSGLLGALVPDSLLETFVGRGIGAMLFMLFMGIPMYICATSSTPLAAALILKGVSPGAALVFLLAGPATNISALPVLLRILGKKGLAIYLGSIAAVAVLSGLLVDWLYKILLLDPQSTMGAHGEALPWGIHLLGVLFLGGCTLALLLKKRVPHSHSPLEEAP